MAAPRKGRLGVPQGEIALVIALAGLGLGVIAWWILPLLERAEKSAMELQLVNLRSGLRLEIARELLAGRRPAGLLSLDPLSLLETGAGKTETTKMSYLAKNVASGEWSFDVASRKLLYHPVRYRYLKTPDGQALNELGWRLEAREGDGEPVLRLLTPYRWF